MKIGVLIPRAREAAGGEPPLVSGGTFYDLKIAEQLTAAGHQVHVIDTPMSLATRELDNWVRQLGRYAFDLLLEDELGFEAYGPLNHRLDRQGGGPARVGVMHVPTARLDRERGTQRAEYTFLTSVHLNVFVSQAVLRDSEQLLGPVSASVVVPPGIDHLPRLPRPPSQTGKLQLINVGHLLPHKGQLELLDVLAQLPGSDWSATLVGRWNVDGGYAERVRARCAELGLGSRVRLAGELSSEALARALAQADVFLASSHYESFGLAIAEAVRAGVPIVGWTQGGPWDYLVDGRSALRVFPQERKAFAAALRRLMDDGALRQTLEAGVAQAAQMLPSWEETARVLEKALVQLRADRTRRKETPC